MRVKPRQPIVLLCVLHYLGRCGTYDLDMVMQEEMATCAAGEVSGHRRAHGLRYVLRVTVASMQFLDSFRMILWISVTIL